MKHFYPKFSNFFIGFGQFLFSFENPEDYEIKSEPWKRSFLQYRDARHIFPDNENIPTAHTKRKMRPNRIKSIYDIENSENTDIIFLHEGKNYFGSTWSLKYI